MSTEDASPEDNSIEAKLGLYGYEKRYGQLELLQVAEDAKSLEVQCNVCRVRSIMTTRKLKTYLDRFKMYGYSCTPCCSDACRKAFLLNARREMLERVKNQHTLVRSFLGTAGYLTTDRYFSEGYLRDVGTGDIEPKQAIEYLIKHLVATAAAADLLIARLGGNTEALLAEFWKPHYEKHAPNGYKDWAFFIEPKPKETNS